MYFFLRGYPVISLFLQAVMWLPSRGRCFLLSSFWSELSSGAVIFTFNAGAYRSAIQPYDISLRVSAFAVFLYMRCFAFDILRTNLIFRGERVICSSLFSAFLDKFESFLGEIDNSLRYLLLLIYILLDIYERIRRIWIDEASVLHEKFKCWLPSC